MPKRVADLQQFLTEIELLLQLIERCSSVLFRQSFRSQLPEVTGDVVARLREVRDNEHLMHPEGVAGMEAAGLASRQLEFKLQAFERALTDFEQEAGESRLVETLETGGTILGSLAGAIPGFGSFAQEFVDFLMKEAQEAAAVLATLGGRFSVAGSENVFFLADYGADRGHQLESRDHWT